MEPGYVLSVLLMSPLSPGGCPMLGCEPGRGGPILPASGRREEPGGSRARGGQQPLPLGQQLPPALNERQMQLGGERAEKLKGEGRGRGHPGLMLPLCAGAAAGRAGHG